MRRSTGDSKDALSAVRMDHEQRSLIIQKFSIKHLACNERMCALTQLRRRQLVFDALHHGIMPVPGSGFRYRIFVK